MFSDGIPDSFSAERRPTLMSQNTSNQSARPDFIGNRSLVWRRNYHPCLASPYSPVIRFPNLAQNRGFTNTVFDEEDNSQDVSVTESEWSKKVRNYFSRRCPKQCSIDAAVALSDGKPEVAAEILTRLLQVAIARGTSEQRLTHYMLSAFVNPTGNASDLYRKEHAIATHLLYDFSPCFKLGFIAANLAIIEASFDNGYKKIHVLDFEIGQGAQYVHLLHVLAKKKRSDKSALKITAFTDFPADGNEKLKTVGDALKKFAKKIGVSLSFHVRKLNYKCLNRETLGIKSDEALAVNFAFKLYRLPDESVSTENLRDKVLRRVKALSPVVMTVVEQEMNTNTAALISRVRDTCEYYAALFDSLDATMSRDNSERVKIEEGLGRRIGNSVACEGRERVERCEVFSKWRARMSMAGFQQRPMSQITVESLRSKLNSVTRGKPGFSVNEESGGICVGWMGRNLTIASAWR